LEVVPQWCYNCVTMVLQWCYYGVIMVKQLCENPGCGPWTAPEIPDAAYKVL
jgi:hypothetical protein